jgi:alkylated DNA nucleotide flippase Atl1
VLNAVTHVLPSTSHRRRARPATRRASELPVGSNLDLRIVGTRCSPLDEDVWHRVVALRRETDDAHTGERWQEWAQALRAAVDGGHVRLMLVMDGPRLIWFAVVAIHGDISLPEPHVRMRAGTLASLPC